MRFAGCLMVLVLMGSAAGCCQGGGYRACAEVAPARQGVERPWSQARATPEPEVAP